MFNLKSTVMKSKKEIRTFVFGTSDDKRAILVRLVVGLIFLTEGIQKFLFPDLLGPGRFLKIGFNDPAFWAYFTGTFEIICSLFVLIGMLTRLASVPLFIIMMVAFVATKWPILLEKGIWVMSHEYRTDFALTLLLIYLMIYGAGNYSVDFGIMENMNT
jgi:putative oxidoreductase